MYDILPDSWVEAFEKDADGDFTAAGLANRCYIMTASADPSVGGSVDVPPGGCAGDYALGEEVELTANPAPGYVFAGWSGDASGTSNPLPVTMDDDKNIYSQLPSKPYLRKSSRSLVQTRTRHQLQVWTLQ